MRQPLNAGRLGSEQHPDGEFIAHKLKKHSHKNAINSQKVLILHSLLGLKTEYQYLLKLCTL